ncbi:MAG: hypothetical protein KAI97_08430, partial [Gemmatimonadetes bacterium]|nr:hypothetical protein [Gemmatimonadota bacterium]
MTTILTFPPGLLQWDWDNPYWFYTLRIELRAVSSPPRYDPYCSARAIFRPPMTSSTPQSDLTRLTETLAVQLEASRRRFMRGNAMYVSANLVLAGLAWRLPSGGVLGWLPPAIGVLGNVFYALTTEWELRW